MKLYYLSDGDLSPFYSKLSDAKRDARNSAKRSYDAIEVFRVEISTNRENILRLANEHGGIMTTMETVYTAPPKLKRGN